MNNMDAIFLYEFAWIQKKNIFCVPDYSQTSNIWYTLDDKIVDHSDVVGALPVGAAPTTSSFWT